MTRRTSRAALTVLGTVSAAGLAAAVWGVGIERHLYTLRLATAYALPEGSTPLRVLHISDAHMAPWQKRRQQWLASLAQLKPDLLPEGSTPLRVLHISDAHMAPWQKRRQQWLASLAQLKPDLVINTGDNLGHRHGLDGIRRAFAPFAGVPGAFVHGSNDKYAPSPRNPFRYFLGPSTTNHEPDLLDTDALDDFLMSELGWARLDNEAASLQVAGKRIDVVGVDDAHREWDDIDAVTEELAALRADASANTPLLAVTHAPYQRVLNSFVDLGADMIFGGHTHGGQVCLPGYGTIVANCDIPRRQARGLSTWEHAGRRIPLHVSAGCGHSIYAPVRFACRPEATLLTLMPAASGN
ncbi:metallophosphoesterase [Microbacterium sp. YY-01]|uniref:metallophosphoesterase n=1 Tax=Microbacterium sp. YY-01 TaxID=3421634 RepID=UPI003D186CC6